MASKEIKNNLKRNQILMIMKKLLLLFPLLLSCLWGIAADEFRVAELRCEYRDNPLAINTLTPQFSWQTLSVGRGFLQAGYQIQVASDPADLARGRKLLWDEQRKSDVSLHVRYAGRTLKPGQRYYWRVRVSDAAGNYSPWSEIRSFAVGLLDGSDWDGARWIAFEELPDSLRVVPGQEFNKIKIGDRKTALFVIISDTDDTFNFIVAMMYTQLFNLLCDKADDVYGGRLPVHVRFLLDEMANIAQIPKFEKLIATIRSREISASIILQAQSQLKAIYKDNADTIIGNCDTTLFLGGKEKTTLKEISETLGKETIDMYNTSETRSNQKSYGLNYQKLGKELMTQDELSVMDGGKCILQLRGVRPFLSEKYDITAHPRYKYLSDADKKNEFDIERFLNRRPAVVKENEQFDLYNVDVPDEEKKTD